MGKTVPSHFHMPVRPMLLHRPSFLFDCFVKIWATCKTFLGKWFTAPLAKKIAHTPMIWITKRFSLVRECNVFLQCCITLGPARQFSLQNVKLSRIVTYRSKIIRVNCSLNWSYINLLWRIELWLSKLQLSVFLKIVWVFWLERVVPPFVTALNKLNSLFKNCFVIATVCDQACTRTGRPKVAGRGCGGCKKYRLARVLGDLWLQGLR